MKKLLTSILLGMWISGCTTAVYTTPEVVDANKHIYHFAIETGGFSNELEADQRLVEEVNKFMTQNGYSHYQILHRDEQIVRMSDEDGIGPKQAGYTYTIQFNR